MTVSHRGKDVPSGEAVSFEGRMSLFAWELEPQTAFYWTLRIGFRQHSIPFQPSFTAAKVRPKRALKKRPSSFFVQTETGEGGKEKEGYRNTFFCHKIPFCNVR